MYELFRATTKAVIERSFPESRPSANQPIGQICAGFNPERSAIRKAKEPSENLGAEDGPAQPQ
jgi:hypothetical protein